MSSGGGEQEVFKRLDLRVKEVIRANPLTIAIGATVMQAAKAMEKRDESCVFVKSRGEIVGIITERDIARRVVAKGVSPKTKLKGIMTSPIIVVSPDTKIEEALNIMAKNKVRRLPVMGTGQALAGVVTVADIAKALADKAGYTSELITTMTKENPPPIGVYG